MVDARQNVKMEVGSDGVLTIRVQLKDVQTYPSVSGKTRIIATTGGNVPVAGFPDVKVGLNIYTK